MMMTGKTRILLICPTLVFLVGMYHLGLPPAGAREQVGLLTVIGMVKVNGKPAAAGDIVASGSAVQTAKGSSADVSLGELGRVEVLPSTTMKLRYDETNTTHTLASVAILLGEGSVRASSAEGIVFNVESGMTVTRSSLPSQNVFTVDATCGVALVSVTKGKVELGVGNSVKQIAAGGRDTAGHAKAGCIPSHNP